MATRRTSRRLGNENATASANALTSGLSNAGKTRLAGGLGSKASQSATTSLPVKTAATATKRTTRTSQLAVSKDPNTATAGGALQSKTTNKQVLAAGEAGPSKAAGKPTKIARSRVAPAVHQDADENAAAEPPFDASNATERPIKNLRGTSRAAASTTKTARPAANSSKSLLPAKRPTATRKPQAVADDVFLTRQAETLAEAEEELEEEEEEEAEEVNVERKKRAKVEPAKPPKDAGWEDLDAGDEDDPLMVSEYVNEVYEYLLEKEKSSVVPSNYMDIQTEITWRMRGILVDWLIEIHTSFRLLPETIFLAINIVDRFCATQVVSLVKYQLMGITALFIAAKYEEVVCPSVSNFLYMTDGGYSDDELLKAERWVLQMIGWDLSYPNPLNYLRRISKADDYDNQCRTVAKYFLEMSCVDRHLLAYPPSVLAAASAWLARKVLDRGEWDANLVHYSAYSEEELLPCAQTMINYIVRNVHIATDTEHPNFHKKYASRKFFKASEIVRDWVLENLFSMEDHDALESYFDQTYTGSGPRPPARAEGDIASSSPDRVHIRLEEWAKY